MKDARPQHASLLDFVQIEDFTSNADFKEAVQGVDGVIHAASVFTSPDERFHSRIWS